ncbi:DUF4142 domain-containing protein [Hymenobacter sp. J193]|uniref:DUF4142 domain-containing protein n=1 Tax=Hymenobacter sp. J193 TaxID=2898429 RepID=UPI0021513554|nr:DUF4142 domain-containing protein [Hymenobacter sp. J193]MCR5887935.1 DUF4142 domain-containing protein [Hymenobacter sp. J193]
MRFSSPKIFNCLPFWFSAIALSITLAACSSNSEQQDPVAAARFENERRIGEADVTSKQERDAEFLVNAAAGGQLLTEASRLALQKATLPAVRNFAARLLKEHAAIGQGLQVVAQQKSITVPSGLGNEQQDQYQKLTAASGSAFDKQYVELLLDMHNKQEDAFDDMREEAYDGDIRGFAAKYYPVLSDHLSQIKQLEDQTENLP